MSEYPPQLEIKPLANVPRATVQVPGSKSITNRALVLAALTATDEREIVLENVLQCEDTEVMVDSLRRLGFMISLDWNARRVSVGPWNGWPFQLPGYEPLTYDLWVG